MATKKNNPEGIRFCPKCKKPLKEITGISFVCLECNEEFYEVPGKAELFDSDSFQFYHKIKNFLRGVYDCAFFHASEFKIKHTDSTVNIYTDLIFDEVKKQGGLEWL